MTEDQLRELYARALASPDRMPRKSDQCVTAESMLALVQREGPESQRLRTLDHVMSCNACRRELDLLRAIEQAGADLGVAADTRSWPGWPRFSPLAVAASVVLAFGVALGIRYAGDQTDIPRGGGGAVVLLTPPKSVAGNQPVAFAWRRVPHASQYVFELLDERPGGNGTPALARTTSDTSLLLEPTQLRRGQDYQWWVRALTPAGELASPMRSLRVRDQ